MAEFYLGVDFGGGAGKATLLRSDGTVAATAAAEYPTRYGADGTAEQDPQSWFEAAAANIRAVLQASGAKPAEVSCIGFDAATHTAVLCDENFSVLRDSVYWTDTRSSAAAESLRREHGEAIFAACRHYPDTIWTLPQLLFLRGKEPHVYQKIAHIFFAKDYVRHLITGDFLTDRIEAEGSMLFDVRTGDWSEELLALAGLDRAVMPRIARPEEIAGRVTAEAAARTGLAAGTPVIVGTTDTALEVFASGAVRAGQATVKLATAGRICCVAEKPVPDRNIVNYSFIKEGLYYPGSATKSAAASYRWFRDAFGGTYAELDALAGQVPPGSDGLLFHPYLNGELTPYADPTLRGSFVGIGGRHAKGHFARAVMEGVAFSMLDCLLYLRERGLAPAEAFAIGGGVKSPLWRSILADTLGMRLFTTEHNDSSFGCAMLAAVAAGRFADADEAAAVCCRVTGETVPDGARHEVYRRSFERYRRTGRALAGT